MSFKCTGCGAEVTVNTDNAMTARCHWCRHTLGVNEQVANGAVPDAVLPFHIRPVSYTHLDVYKRQEPAHRIGLYPNVDSMRLKALCL